MEAQNIGCLPPGCDEGECRFPRKDRAAPTNRRDRRGVHESRTPER